MTVTVRMDVSDNIALLDRCTADIRREAVVRVFNEIANDEGNNVRDVALILRVDGIDIAVICAHCAANDDTGDIELF